MVNRVRKYRKVINKDVLGSSALQSVDDEDEALEQEAKGRGQVNLSEIAKGFGGPDISVKPSSSGLRKSFGGRSPDAEPEESVQGRPDHHLWH